MIKIKQKITGENILSKCVTVIRNEHTTVQIVCECAGGGGVGRGWGLFYYNGAHISRPKKKMEWGSCTSFTTR